MFVGACAGSTGGGIKVSRLLILCKSARKELQLYLHPNAVKKIKMDDKAIPHEVVRATNMFLFVYIMIFVTSLLIISLDNLDMVSNFTAIAACIAYDELMCMSAAFFEVQPYFSAGGGVFGCVFKQMQ